MVLPREDRKGPSPTRYVHGLLRAEGPKRQTLRNRSALPQKPRPLAFIRAERLPGIDPGKRTEGAPDLGVEVVLPTGHPEDLVLKIPFKKSVSFVSMVSFRCARLDSEAMCGRKRLRAGAQSMPAAGRTLYAS